MIPKTAINQFRDYASLFSRSVALDWFKGDFRSINYKIERYDKKRFSDSKKTYLDYLKYAYKSIERHYPNEYVYKNAFLNEWLIQELGQLNAKVFSEFRLGKTVADLVMFNGVSKVFEIKTELDTTKRLENQIDSYKDIFNEIYLIVPLSRINQYLSLDETIGVISFSNETNKKFKIERHAVRNFNIQAKSLMNVLHTFEYRNVVSQYFKELPPMNSFNQFKICSELLTQIPNLELNQLFINQLKKRGKKNELSARNYLAFNQLSLALKLGVDERALLFQTLKTPIKF
jgi:hypothetical protein